MRRFFFLGFSIAFSIHCFAGIVAPPVSKSDAVNRATFRLDSSHDPRVELPAANTGTGPHDFYALFAKFGVKSNALYGVEISMDKKLSYSDAQVIADGIGPLEIASRQQMRAGFGQKVSYIEAIMTREAIEKASNNKGVKLRLASSGGRTEFVVPGWMFGALLEAADKKDYARQARAAEAKRKQARKDARDIYLSEHAELSERVRSAILQEEVVLGMSPEDVTASWGPPSHINKTVNIHGVSEQWVYGDTYVYFENGKLTSWQSSQ